MEGNTARTGASRPAWLMAFAQRVAPKLSLPSIQALVRDVFQVTGRRKSFYSPCVGHPVSSERLLRRGGISLCHRSPPDSNFASGLRRSLPPGGPCPGRHHPSPHTHLSPSTLPRPQPASLRPRRALSPLLPSARRCGGGSGRPGPPRGPDWRCRAAPPPLLPSLPPGAGRGPPGPRRAVP